jgi:ADP-ribose pyrophosphatase YjhB (NUDIX family)
VTGTTTDRSQPVATPLVAAGALFTDNDGSVLLVRPTYKPYWDIPGGYAEPGESPGSACVREVREELGLRVPIGRLLSVDWAPHPDEGAKILFVFDGGSLTDDQLATIAFRDGEIAEYRFVAPSEIERLTIPRLARRLLTTLNLQADGRSSAYLEDGMAHEALREI